MYWWQSIPLVLIAFSSFQIGRGRSKILWGSFLIFSLALYILFFW